MCKFCVSRKYIAFHPTLYITRNFVLARRRLFFHISPLSSFWRLPSFVAINRRALKVIGPLAALERLFEIKPAKDRKPPFPRPVIQITLRCPREGWPLVISSALPAESRLHMTTMAALQGLNFNDECHKTLLHGLTPGKVILCTVRDLCHLESLSFLSAICRVLLCLGCGRSCINSE